MTYSSFNAIFEFSGKFTIRCIYYFSPLQESTKHADFWSGCSSSLKIENKLSNDRHTPQSIHLVLDLHYALPNALTSALQASTCCNVCSHLERQYTSGTQIIWCIQFVTTNVTKREYGSVEHYRTRDRRMDCDFQLHSPSHAVSLGKILQSQLLNAVQRYEHALDIADFQNKVLSQSHKFHFCHIAYGTVLQ